MMVEMWVHATDVKDNKKQRQKEGSGEMRHETGSTINYGLPTNRQMTMDDGGRPGQRVIENRS